MYFLCVVDSCLRTNNAAASWQWPCVFCLKCRYFCSFYIVWAAPEESIGIPMICALTSEFAVPLPPSPGEVVQNIPAQPGLSINFLDLDIAKLINSNSRLNKPWSDWSASTSRSVTWKTCLLWEGLNSGTPGRWETILKLYWYIPHTFLSLFHSLLVTTPGICHCQRLDSGTDSATFCTFLFDMFLLFVKINQIPNIYQCLTKAVGADGEGHRMWGSVGARVAAEIWETSQESSQACCTAWEATAGSALPECRHRSSGLLRYLLQPEDSWADTKNEQ